MIIANYSFQCMPIYDSHLSDHYASKCCAHPSSSAVPPTGTKPTNLRTFRAGGLFRKRQLRTPEAENSSCGRTCGGTCGLGLAGPGPGNGQNLTKTTTYNTSIWHMVPQVRGFTHRTSKHHLLCQGEMPAIVETTSNSSLGAGFENDLFPKSPPRTFHP